jgi:hypothetical protein
MTLLPELTFNWGPHLLFQVREDSDDTANSSDVAFDDTYFGQSPQNERVGNERTEFLVSSQNFAAASQVFDTMLYSST